MLLENKAISSPICHLTVGIYQTVPQYIQYILTWGFFTWSLSNISLVCEIFPNEQTNSTPNPVHQSTISKIGDLSRGWPEGSFSIATAPRCRGGRYSIPWIATLYSWSLPYNAEAASNTIFWVFGMIRPGIEPRSPGPLANTLLIKLMRMKFRFYNSNKSYYCVTSCSFLFSASYGTLRCLHPCKGSRYSSLVHS